MQRLKFSRWFRPDPVAAQLEMARRELPAPPVPDELLPDSTRTFQRAMASYEEFLAQHEWELALDDLAELGGALAPVPPGFWELLAAAAERVQLTGSDAYWRQWQPRRAE